MEVVSEVNISTLRQIISSTDPRDAVGKVLKELHKDLAEIQKRADKVKLEEKLKLKKIEDKIGEAINILSAGEDPELAIDLLNKIKDADPQVYEMIKPEVEQLKDAAETVRKLRIKSVNNTSNGVMV